MIPVFATILVGFNTSIEWHKTRFIDFEAKIEKHFSPVETRYDIGNFESDFTAFTEFALADPTYGPAVRQHLKKLLDR